MPTRTAICQRYSHADEKSCDDGNERIVAHERNGCWWCEILVESDTAEKPYDKRYAPYAITLAVWQESFDNTRYAHNSSEDAREYESCEADEGASDESIEEEGIHG